MLIHHREHVLTFKWRAAAQHFVEHHTNRVDIGACRAALAPQLLRGHIIRCPNRT